MSQFRYEKFAEIDINDPFFNSLKEDYPEFENWFEKKSLEQKNALVYEDEQGVGAFLYLKQESESIRTNAGELEQKSRIKIGTLKIENRLQGIRNGEGALGVALWFWRDLSAEEIYITIFPKYTDLVEMVEKFGFKKVAENERGENIYLRSKKSIDFGSPFTAFPFIKGDAESAKLIPIFDNYHDQLFPYSELSNNNSEVEQIVAGNGVVKTFIGFPSSEIEYRIGQPTLIYRIYNGEGQKTYKSVVTSFVTISDFQYVKKQNQSLKTKDEYLKLLGNKTAFSKDELEKFYDSKPNLVVIEMLYNGYFGRGHNVTHNSLHNQGLFETYPYQIEYTMEQFKQILEMGGVNVQILLSINPEHIENILNGTKKYEYRRIRPKREVDSIVVYATSPICRVVAELKISKTLEGKPANIWEETKNHSGISKRFFSSYYKSRKNAIAFEIEEVKEYEKPMVLSSINVKATPQSFVYLED